MLLLQNIVRSFDDKRVLRGIDLEVGTGEIVCLLGPSGCGKTTALRIVAGLETADSGNVLLDGTSIMAIPVHEREFGLMFQEFALFPHMDVARNITFGLRMAHTTHAAQEMRLHEVLELVGLQGFERRDIAQLSGGEKQRVALARSLASHPRLLMLDEPLGSLDAALRERLVGDLRTIIKKAGLTALYVTHDQREAFAIADRIAVMNAGKIEQIATPPALYHHPGTEFVARFLGFSNVIDAAHEPVLSETKSGAKTLLLHPDGLHIGGEHDTHVRSGVITESIFSGDSYRVTVEIAPGYSVTFNPRSRDHDDLSIGQSIWVKIDLDYVLPLNG